MHRYGALKQQYQQLQRDHELCSRRKHSGGSSSSSEADSKDEKIRDLERRLQMAAQDKEKKEDEMRQLRSQRELMEQRIREAKTLKEIRELSCMGAAIKADSHQFSAEEAVAANSENGTMINLQLSEQVSHLTEKVDDYEQQIEQLELANQDWDMEKQALEDLVVKLRHAVKMKEQQLSNMAEQYAKENLESDLSMESTPTLEELQDLQLEKEALRNELQSTKEKNVHLEEECCQKEEQLKQSLASQEKQREQFASQIQELSSPHQELCDAKQTLERQLEDEKAQVAELKSQEKFTAQRDSDYRMLKEKLTSAALALNELHMDKDEMAGKISAHEKHIFDLVEKLKVSNTEKTVLQRNCEKLAAEKQVLQNDDASNRLFEKHAAAKFETEQQTQKQHSNSVNEHVGVQDQLTCDDCAKLQQAAVHLEKTNYDLSKQKSHLEEQVILLRQKANDAVEHCENIVANVTHDQNFLKLTQVMEKLKILIDEKDLEITDKTAAIDQVELDVRNHSVMTEKLKAEIASLLSTISNKDAQLSHLSTSCDGLRSENLELVNCLNKLRKDIHKSGTDDSIKTQDNVDKLSAALRDKEISELASKPDEACEDPAAATELKALAEEFRKQGFQLQGQVQKIKDLEMMNKTLDSENNVQKQRIESYIIEVESLKKQLSVNNMPGGDSEKHILEDPLINAKSTSDKSFVKLMAKLAEYRKHLSADILKHIDDGDNDIIEMLNGEECLHPTAPTNDNEFNTLMKEKETEIRNLKDEQETMLRILEDHSTSGFGNNVLVTVHNLESKVKAMQDEKEKLLSVLNEKSRECSSLRSEVHRLMNVISADKSALTKLQKDNQELQLSKGSNDSDHESMKKEAIQSLSRIIQDRDIEIDALKQKNESLLKLLQENSSDGQQIQGLLLERENLSRQIKGFQNDREQLIATVNQKHQENLSYHAEIQRLTTMLSRENESNSKLHGEYTKLVQQFEDKQKSLINTQNELVSLRQKVTSLEQKYDDLIARRQRSLSERSDTRVGDQSFVSPEHVPSQERAPSLEIVPIQEHAPSLELVSHVASSTDTSVQNANTESFQHKPPTADEDVRLREIKQLKDLIGNRDRALADKDKWLLEKDRIVHNKTVQLRQAEETITTRDKEIQALKHQIEGHSMQLSSLQNEVDGIRREMGAAEERLAGQVSENGMMKETNNKLVMSLQEKDFELKALQEKTSTLSELVQKQGMSENSQEVQRLLQESETMQARAQSFQHERDQVMLALKQRQAENSELQNQVRTLQERDQRLHRELERLRNHLIQVEQVYTEEAVQAEEREKSLQKRLAATEEKMLSASSAIHSTSLQANLQVESLQEQLHAIADQRDNVTMQLHQSQEQVRHYAASLQNLQMVLEQFQKDSEVSTNAELERCQKQLSSREKEVLRLKEEISLQQNKILDMEEALIAGQRLSEQLDKKEQTIQRYQGQVQELEGDKHELQVHLIRLQTDEDSKVDKIIIKNLFVGYFSTPANQRIEVLHLIANVLNFEESEMAKITGAQQSAVSRWIPGFLRPGNKTPTSSPRSTPDRTPKASANKSFSQMFIQFLENESSPTATVRLPAEKMAEEVERKAHHAQHNPFISPLPPGGATSTPTRVRSSRQHSQEHLLMKSVYASLPTFTPIPVDRREDSAILKNVLQPSDST